MDPKHFADYLAITEVKANYCRYLDSKDWDAYADLFTEDFELDSNPASGEVIRGREAAVADIRSYVEHAQTAHQVHTPIMDIRGDEADVIWAMQDRVIGAAKIPEKAHTGYGQYHERYVKRNGRWRIARLKLRYFIFDAEPK